MRKTMLVLRHELVTTLARPSYLLIAFGIPLLAVLVFAAVTIFRGSSPVSGVSPDAPDSSELEIEGYVDQAGLISIIPQNIPSGYLIAYPNEEQAQRALEASEIAAYFVIPEDYIGTGNLLYIRPNPSPFSAHVRDSAMRWTLLVNVLGGDVELATRVWNPANLSVTNLTQGSQPEQACAQPGMTCESNLLIRYLPMIMLVLFYLFITTGSSLLLRSISAEKENRMMEILMLSISPLQMLTGKIVGLGIAALLQMLAWVGTVYVVLRTGGQTLNLPAGFQIPPSLLAWGLVFFLLGYALYASLMAGAGALVPDIKQAPLVSLLFYVPAFIGFEISLFSASHPHGVLATAASIFPLTAPFSMMNRLVVGGVPVWQLVLSVGLMLVAVPLIVRAVAGMFHAQNLLSGQPFSIRRYVRALLGWA
jgi:ABC-2 type transport system permease protein